MLDRRRSPVITPVVDSALDKLMDLVSDLELPAPQAGVVHGGEGVWMRIRTWAGGTIETWGANVEHAAAVLLDLEFPGYLDYDPAI